MLNLRITLLAMVLFGGFSLATAQEMERWSPVSDADLMLQSMKDRDQIEPGRQKKENGQDKASSESLKKANVVNTVSVYPSPIFIDHPYPVHDHHHPHVYPPRIYPVPPPPSIKPHIPMNRPDSFKNIHAPRPNTFTPHPYNRPVISPGIKVPSYRPSFKAPVGGGFGGRR